MDMSTSKAQRAEIEALLGAGQSRARKIFRWRNLLLLLVIAGAGYGGWRYYAPATPVQANNFVTAPVTQANMTIKVTATGTVQPTNKVDISSELSGTVRAVKVDFNSFVKKGDVLAELDMVKLTASVENSRARLNIALAAVEEAKISLDANQKIYERKRQLTERNFSSIQDTENAKATYDRSVVSLENAKANVEAARAQLKLDETNLARTRITSPIDGVILMRKVDPGQTVASSLQAPVLFTIAEDLKRMEIQVDVDEADVGKVKEGDKASFSVDAYPNRKFEAQVRMLRYGSEVVQGVVTYKAVLTTDNTALLLRPGMTATAEITVEQISNALTVLNQALRYQPPRNDTQANERSFLQRILPGPRPAFRAASQQRTTNGATRIWVLRDGQPAPVRVVTGSSDGQRTQILRSELKAGDLAIVDNATRRNR